MDQKVQGQLRAAIAAIAGIAIYKGYITEEAAGWVIGIGMYCITSLWSWISKKK